MIFQVFLRGVQAGLATLLLTLSIDATACSGRLHVEVRDSGVYTLDYAAIVAQQPGLKDCASSDLNLANRGKEVPIRLVDDGSGRFGPGSRIEWVGQALHGPESWYDTYSTVNVYQLGAAPGAHARMREASSNAPAKSAVLTRHLHFEQENLMIRLSDREMKAGQEPDIWQWAKLTPIDSQAFIWNFDLTDIDLRDAALRAAPVTLKFDFRGLSNVVTNDAKHKPVDHVVDVLLNGKPLSAQSWDGRSEVRMELVVPRALLKDKGNSVSLRVPRRATPTNPENFIVDVVMFNWFEASYPIRGNLGASTAALTTTSDASIDLDYTSNAAPQLFGANGDYRRMTSAGNGHWRAAGFGGNVEIYPVTEERMLSPTLLRPIADLDLRNAQPGYDYLMVAHPRLQAAVQPLAQYHRDHGLKVEVLNVDDVYDEFNAGISHPRAIRNLVDWGTQHWPIKPRFLLLVGDASADIHHDVRTERLNSTSSALRPEPFPSEMMQQGGLSSMPTTSYAEWDPELPNRNLIPTWQFPSFEGQAASDNGFVTLAEGDFHPKLAVGRFPVVEPAEVAAIVDKTIAYLSKPPPGDWRRDVTFISTDEVASFKLESDKIATDLGHQGFAVNSIYTKQDVAEVVTTHAALKKNLDAGNLLVHFLGHGGAFIWRVGPPADLFTLDDVSKLENVGRYPMVLAMTCFSAPFDNPTEDSIGERFLREKDKGAVAVFAASWTNSPNPAYSKILIAELLKPNNPIGNAIVAAKAKIKDRVFVEMYNLLGDPALVLARPEQLQLMRGPDRWNAQVIVHVPERGFGGEVNVDWLDANGKTLGSNHYEARDDRFALTVPAGRAEEVRVYAADLRNGYTAFGSLSLSEPIKPPPPKPGKSVPVVGAVAAAPKGARPKSPPVLPLAANAQHRPDQIARLGFDAAPANPSKSQVVAPSRDGTSSRQPDHKK